MLRLLSSFILISITFSAFASDPKGKEKRSPASSFESIQSQISGIEYESKKNCIVHVDQDIQDKMVGHSILCDGIPVDIGSSYSGTDFMFASTKLEAIFFTTLLNNRFKLITATSQFNRSGERNVTLYFSK